MLSSRLAYLGTHLESGFPHLRTLNLIMLHKRSRNDRVWTSLVCLISRAERPYGAMHHDVSPVVRGRSSHYSSDWLMHA